MENNSQAIEIKGIVRNQTKIGVQDGQCDDIVNLRFKDGSWRVADDGKQVYQMPSNRTYSQLYVHTNVYHHLLGVSNDKLYWFANIEADGETFTNLDNPVEICDVQGDVTIVQNGHLLTIIGDGKSSINYAIFVTGTNEYKVLNVNANGEQTDRGLYPFGKVHFNVVSSDSDEYSVTVKEWGDVTFLTPYESNSYAIEKLAEKGLISMPLLAIAAIKDYSGNYLMASNPQYIFPKEKFYYLQEEGKSIAITYKYTGETYNDKNLVKIDKVGICDWSNAKDGIIDCDENPSYFKELSEPIPPMNILMNTVPLFHGVSSGDYETIDRYYFGSKLTLSIDNFDFIKENEDVFQSLCVFVTRQINVFPNAINDISECDKDYDSGETIAIRKNNAYESVYYRNVRAKKYVIDDLLNSPFYLLREYDKNNISELKESPIIDLSAAEYKDVLKPDVLIHRDRIDNGAFDRKDFLPKTAYQYNTKLHIANYKTYQFHGYPIDFFQLSNHNVKVKSGSYACGGVLPNLEDGADVQYPRSKVYFIDSNYQEAEHYIDLAKQINAYFAMVSVTIETQQGEQEVVRYIAPYDAHIFKNGDNANFIEQLSPLLTFPDYRAKDIEIRIAYMNSQQDISWIGGYFKLQAHPFLNLSYYINSSLKPISFHYDFMGGGSCHINNFDDYGDNQDFLIPKEKNNTEDYPNGLKVSMTNNPFTFPYESTYQVGASEIVALMSNAVAIGTGQTGAAPLYVFCKDGIYSLMVDATGEMTYTNARIIARDVCNNAKSVTPIDSGVVFTTERGLMSIAGSEVVEIGSAAEGDVFDITDNGNLPTNHAMADKAKKIMFNAFTMQQLAEFPEGLIGNTDFLTYLKGAIINYNHNERELMVSNPDKDYTYVMDRNGNWSRRAFTAQEYVNNYPTSYRIDKEGKFYKVDTDDNDTNKIYLLSNVIKLGTIAFKQAYRLIVRGYFETYSAAYGKINGVNVKVVGSFIDGMKAGEGLQMTYKTQYGQAMWVDVDNNNYVLNGQIQILDPATNEDITYSVVSVNSGQYYRVVKSYEKVGCYVFGSYDGRQWSLLGGNEKGGKFTDIGCKIAHTDIRYLRVCLAGKLSKDTRIDYIEVSADGSALNGKLR